MRIIITSLLLIASFSTAFAAAGFQTTSANCRTVNKDLLAANACKCKAPENWAQNFEVRLCYLGKLVVTVRNKGAGNIHGRTTLFINTGRKNRQRQVAIRKFDDNLILASMKARSLQTPVRGTASNPFPLQLGAVSFTGRAQSSNFVVTNLGDKKCGKKGNRCIICISNTSTLPCTIRQNLQDE